MGMTIDICKNFLQLDALFYDRMLVRKYTQYLLPHVKNCGAGAISQVLVALVGVILFMPEVYKKYMEGI